MLKRSSAEIIKNWQFTFEDGPPIPITTPHSWNAFDTMRLDDSWYRRGVGTYEMELTTSAEKRTFIRFGAASQKAVVYWNEVEVGRNEGGYLPFTVELPKASSGILRVEVDNSPDIHLPPSDRSDFFLYGGLTRPVTLYTTGEQRIAHLQIEPQLNNNVGQLSLNVHVDGAGEGMRCHLRVTDPDGAIVCEETTDYSSLSRHEVSPPLFPNPQRWSPSTPHLYKIHLSLWQGDTLSDEVKTHFGWRTFEFLAGGPFYLNGERLLLRGTHRHEDWSGCANAVDEADTRAEFERMKAVGMNFIRLGHYPQADFVHTLCDELGLVVWDELPWCRGGVGGDQFKARTRSMLRTMIAEHHHHPSIIFWGMGNELDWEYDHDCTDDDVFAFLQEVNALAHELDPTRLTALRRYERGASVVDVYSPSIWSGWYRGRYQDYEWALTDAIARFPRMLHMEWSADNHIGRHNTGPHLPFELERERDHSEQDGLAYSTAGFARASRDGDWSESYFLDLAAWTLRVQQSQPNLAGSAQWAFKDFGTPLRPENPIPYVNQKGIVDRKNRPKTAFYLFQAAQTDTPVCHIEAHSWPVRVGDLSEKQRVRVITNCETVELFLNGASQGTHTDGWLRAWQLDLPEGDNAFRAVGTMADGQIVEDNISQTFVAATDKPPTQWRATTQEEGNDMRVTVQMVDVDGNPVVAPEQRVTFGLEGAGRLDVDLGTIDGSRTIETANGRATIVVRDIGVEGIIVTVESELISLHRLHCRVK